MQDMIIKMIHLAVDLVWVIHLAVDLDWVIHLAVAFQQKQMSMV